MTPTFFCISDSSNSLSVLSKNFRKIYRLENFRANVLKSIAAVVRCFYLNLNNFWSCCFLLLLFLVVVLSPKFSQSLLSDFSPSARGNLRCLLCFFCFFFGGGGGWSKTNQTLSHDSGKRAAIFSEVDINYYA